MNKILIIDDDRELCALIKRSIQAENIESVSVISTTITKERIAFTAAG